MSRFYVDITGIPDDFLEFMGYCKLAENDEFELRACKGGEPQILVKEGRRYLYVEDVNDAAVFRARPKVAVPPKSPTTPKRAKRARRR